MDEPFRVILITGFVAVTGFALFYRIRSYTGEKLDRWQEGVGTLVGLRLLALVWFFGVISLMIDPGWMAWSSLRLPTAMRWCGVGLGVFSAALKAWTFRHLDRNLTDSVITRQQHQLVTTGPYRLMRHPFYTSFALDVVAVGLLMANWFVLLSGGLAMAMLVLRTHREEQLLIVRFGDAYRDYMGRTGRFLPRC